MAGVGHGNTWDLVMAAASLLCLIFLNPEPPRSPALVPSFSQAHAYYCAGIDAIL